MDRLPRSTPAEQGVDPAAQLGLVDALDAHPAVEIHSLKVLRHGHVVAEGWWAPYRPERPRLLYSVSKSFTSTALGLALGEGLLRLDDPVIAHFPELAEEVTDPRSRSITVRHLASMSAGHDHDMWEAARTRDPEEPVRGFLLNPPDRPPGSVFAYSQPCTYTLAAILQRRAGMRLSRYLLPRLLEPLGIGEVTWQADPSGRELGFTGLFARTEDVAKLGQLYLQRGRWGDRQLLPESYVEQATSPQIATPAEENLDWRQGYGYQFWMSRHGYRADGAFGQFSLVLPEHDAVVAITAGTEATQELLDHVWAHLLPGIDRDRPAVQAQAELGQRLRGLALPALGGSGHPPGAGEWSAAPFTVTGEYDATGASPAVSVALDEVGEEAVRVTLDEPGNSLSFLAGCGQWSVSEPHDARGDVVPVAATAGWRDGGSLDLQVRFLETPHCLALACSLPARTAHASWQVAPLGGTRLATLHR
jgi:CubicO group peptidase (beta-lactamase class C family)